MSMVYDVSITIPFKNEEKNLEILLPLLAENISKLSLKYEIILIDDHSTDNSIEICKKFSKTSSDIKVIKNSIGTYGQTGAFKNAFKICNGRHIIRMDSDLQDNPDDLYKFELKILDNADLIIGLRENRTHKKIYRIASQLYDLLICILFDSKLYSHSASYVCFKKKYVESLPWYKNDHRYIPIIVINRGAKKIDQIFVSNNNRKYGVSKYNTISKIFFGVFEVIRVIIFLKLGKYQNKNDL